MQAQSYRNASRSLLAQARTELDRGDVRQSSEKGWGAAAQVVKAIAEQRGWRHNSHRLLYDIMGRIVGKTGDGEISNLFRAASVLHTNFYDDVLTFEMVEHGLQDVERMLDKLEPVFQ